MASHGSEKVESDKTSLLTDNLKIFSYPLFNKTNKYEVSPFTVGGYYQPPI